ncbi:MAG TPA: hypothetical protein QGH10_04010 [Armatimonadota bacterium]|nr:hypothetical protein [Armatimonadota bacterium]
MAAEPPSRDVDDRADWVRSRLGRWQAPVGKGAGSLALVRGRVWKLEWDSRKYCVKAPAPLPRLT